LGVLGILDGLVGLEELTLDVGAGLAGHDRRLLVDECQAMEQRRHAAFGVVHAELLLEHGGQLLGRGVQIALQVHVEPGQLGRVKRRRDAAIGDMAQGIESTAAIGLEVVTHRIRVDLQDLSHLLGTPVSGGQHHRLDPVGLALVARRAVRRTQLGQLFGGERVVEHAAKNTYVQWLAATSSERITDEGGKLDRTLEVVVPDRRALLF